MDRQVSSVGAFNTSLIGTCLMEPVETAFGCIGAIAYVFANRSVLIGTKMGNRGWIDRNQLAHYTLHTEIDRRHAVDSFR